MLVNQKLKRMQAKVSKVAINIMGTVSIFMKLPRDRYEHEYVVYPIGKNAELDRVKIQSDKRIGYLYFKDGVMELTKSNGDGAYNFHLMTQKLIAYTLCPFDLKVITEEIKRTTGDKIGKSIILSDNSNASLI